MDNRVGCRNSPRYYCKHFGEFWSNMKTGNLISFKLLIDGKGTLVTELSGVPDKELHKIFKGSQLDLIRTLLRLCNNKLQPLHKNLEDELDALNHGATT